MEEKEKRKNELYGRMKEIRLPQHATFGYQFRHVRGKGFAKRDESVDVLGEKKRVGKKSILKDMVKKHAKEG